MCVLEIGPGSLPHVKFWQGSPEKFISVEVDEQFHQLAREKCQADFHGLTRLRGDHRLDLPNESVDLVLTFYSLEHLDRLDENVDEISRVLKPGGILLGAVPNEGGLLWGLGRFLTTRRWIRKKYALDYDKIIAWEHPNFVDDIRLSLGSKMVEQEWSQIPFPGLRSYNLNLISRFRFTKKK
jgi:SAM-dependent methyltransferase